ncbi:hypothetical protein N7535_005089 [Penicillium sp. DV-2018c]|nr:hypothetical protein N7535_005089 [Penicillium sp. DV-2018c]
MDFIAQHTYLHQIPPSTVAPFRKPPIFANIGYYSGYQPPSFGSSDPRIRSRFIAGQHWPPGSPIQTGDLSDDASTDPAIAKV